MLVLPGNAIRFAPSGVSSDTSCSKKVTAANKNCHVIPSAIVEDDG